MDSGDRSSTRRSAWPSESMSCSRTACGCGETPTLNLEWSRRSKAPSGDPEEQRDIIRLVVCDREVGKPVPVEIRDGQVYRILAGGTGPRHLEAAVTVAGQHEDAVAAGNHEVKPSVAIQIVSLDRGGGASDHGVEAIERKLSGGVSIVLS